MDNGVDFILLLLYVFGKEKLPDIIEGPLQSTPVHTEHPVHNMYIYIQQKEAPPILLS